MSEKVYVLNVYNTMTGQYELIQVTKEVFQATGERNGISKIARNAFLSMRRR